MYWLDIIFPAGSAHLEFIDPASREDATLLLESHFTLEPLGLTTFRSDFGIVYMVDLTDALGYSYNVDI